MIGAGQGSNPGRLLWVGPGPVGRLFLRPPTLTASNFAALWPTEPIFTAFKVLILFSTVSKDQKASSNLKVGFALSKWPHFHSAYVIGVYIFFATAVIHKWLFFKYIHYANLISERLLNKPYVNEVTLSKQNPALKCCQSLELLTHFLKGLDLSMLKIWGL